MISGHARHKIYRFERSVFSIVPLCTACYSAPMATPAAGRIRVTRLDEERMRDGGCEAYLAKPISVAGFLDTIARFLG